MELYIVFGIIALIVVYVIVLYNGLVSKKNRADNSFSQIDVQLKRRHDLIPNLIEVAKKYMKHESDTLMAVTEARNQARVDQKNLKGNPDSDALMTKVIASQNTLGQAMSGFKMTMEAYPDLKASQNMMQLNEELSSTENKISFSRQHYNDEVMTLNVAIESFPANMLSGMFGFSKRIMFEISDEKEREAVKVSF